MIVSVSSKIAFIKDVVQVVLWLIPQLCFLPITIFVLAQIFGNASDGSLSILSGALTAAVAFSALSYTAAKADINEDQKGTYEKAGNYLFRAAMLFGVVLVFHFTTIHKELLAFKPDILIPAYRFIGFSLAGAGFVWLHV